MVSAKQVAVVLVGYGFGLMTAAYTFVPNVTASLGIALIVIAGLYLILSDPWWRTENA